jgi:hypothetical protein
MPEYRLYLLDQKGHIAGHKEFDLPDNKQAMEKAQQFADGRAVELWSGVDLIARILPARKSRDSSRDSPMAFLGSDASQRAEKCREFAAEAKQWAANAAGTELQSIYLDLSRQWTTLAEEIANSDVPSTH